MQSFMAVSVEVFPKNKLYKILPVLKECIWLSAKRCVCNGWLGCAENKRCLKNIFCHECRLNVCENEWGYRWNNCSRNFEAVWEICLIKCEFTAEIQPRKTDSGTEPVSVGAVWLKKTRKSYIYDTYYVSKRSFYKIHESERLPLNLYKSISNFVWSDVICVVIRNANFWQQTENKSDPWHERKWLHMHVRLAVNRQLWKDLTKKVLLYEQNLLRLKLCRNKWRPTI